MYFWSDRDWSEKGGDSECGCASTTRVDCRPLSFSGNDTQLMLMTTGFGELQKNLLRVLQQGG